MNGSKTKIINLYLIFLFAISGIIGIFNFESIFEKGFVSAEGPTYVEGIISQNTTWTLANSPYIIKEKILLEQNVNLTIEPGVTLKFNNNTYLRIDGTLFAVGTKSKIITFTSNKTSPAPYDWEQLRFKKTSKDSVLKYCKIEYSDTAISCDSTSLKIINNEIVNNYIGITLENSYSNITNNVIINNYIGIYLQESKCNLIKNVIINNKHNGIFILKSNSTIINNIISNNNETGLYIISSDSNSQTITIINNNITNNTKDGIFCKYVDSNRQINENYVANNNNGINCSVGSPQINKNLIVNNIFNGIYLSSFCSPQISYNNISINGNGIYINAKANPSIIRNNIQENKNYAIYYEGIEHINVTNNWWGTIDTNLINQSIFDYYDDFELGKVIYIPFRKFSINIYNDPPVADAGPDYMVTINQTISFDGCSSYDPDGYYLIYKWVFGDGTLTNWLSNCNTSHKYNKTGNYDVVLFVNDGEFSDSDNLIITVLENDSKPHSEENDTDKDGMSDEWEDSWDLDKNNSYDANIDSDHDDLTNLEEFLANTNPFNDDTDEDGLSDVDEIEKYKTNPLLIDTDGDDYNDAEELSKHSSPLDDEDIPKKKVNNDSNENYNYYSIIILSVLILIVLTLLLLISFLKKKKLKNR